MNREIQALVEDADVARRLRAVKSAAEAGLLLAEAAAARGLQIGRAAIDAFIGAGSTRPRELAGEELLAVGGGMRAADTWGSKCGNSTYGHTCCWSCYEG